MTDTTEDRGPVLAALAELNDPRLLLAEALATVREAQAADSTDEHQESWHMQLLDEASQLIHIAKVAGELAAQERMTAGVFTAEQFDRLDDPTHGTAEWVAPVREYEPQAVNGVRFTADITCRYMGRVGDALWAYVQGVGFLRVSGAASIDTVTVGMVVGVQFAGRVVSVTPDHALCITDGGTGVTLPRALITESPDE